MFPTALLPTFPEGKHFRLFDLGHPFEKILKAWGASAFHRLPDAPARVDYMPLERMALLTGTVNGVLVVRSTREFAAYLRDLRADTSLGRYDETEVFEELISFNCLYLFHDFWTPEDFQVGPIHPFRSVPSDWPPGDPHAACAYWVEGFPVEIRLWVKD